MISDSLIVSFASEAALYDARLLAWFPEEDTVYNELGSANTHVRPQAKPAGLVDGAQSGILLQCLRRETGEIVGQRRRAPLLPIVIEGGRIGVLVLVRRIVLGHVE